MYIFEDEFEAATLKKNDYLIVLKNFDEWNGELTGYNVDPDLANRVNVQPYFVFYIYKDDKCIRTRKMSLFIRHAN